MFRLLYFVALVSSLAIAAPVSSDSSNQSLVKTGAANQAVSSYEASSWQRLLSATTDKQIWKAACCKVCKKGKACGNSCINRNYTCRKGKGCACDG